MRLLVKDLIQNTCADLFNFLQKQSRFLRHKFLVKNNVLTIGMHSYGTPNVDTYRGSECKVVIGDYCSIARDVTIILGGIHPTDWVSTYPFRIMLKLPGAYEDGMPTTKGDVTIGSDVWIGTEAMILSGVTIGHGVIIASRSLVTKNIPPYAIVAGSPAKIIKFRYNEEIIEKLLAIQWWNWEEKNIREAVNLLSSNNINEFIERYKNINKQFSKTL
ncbi:MAG: CatB-related O-acetyltransferase [Geobacteraceae bacterium]|nr:CatB-related O-acetyltransferase [Geobacteraceae bacterium]